MAKRASAGGDGLRAWNDEAKKIVEAVEKLHAQLLERNTALKIKESAPIVHLKEKLAYGHVKGLLLKDEATPQKMVPNADACELTCSLDLKCKSFSFNTVQKECLISTTALGYSPEAVFYAKTDDGQGFRMYPGMFAPAASAEISKTAADCELDCTAQGHKCRGYSFKATTSECAMTSEPLHFDEEWDYYEKPPRAHVLGHKEDVAAEKMIDTQGREFGKFMKECNYDLAVNSKKKFNALQKKIDKVKVKTEQEIDHLRALKSTETGMKVRAESLTRALENAGNDFKTQNDEMTRAEGRLSRSKLSVQLVEGQLQERTLELQKELQKKIKNKDVPADTKLSSLQESDLKTEKLTDRLTRARQAFNVDDMEVTTLRKAAKDAQITAEHTAKKHIEALTDAQSTLEDMKAARVKLQTYQVDAKELTKVVDRESRSLVPPVEVLEPPSMHSLLRWDTKADEAAATEHAARVEHMKKQGVGMPLPIDIPEEEPEKEPSPGASAGADDGKPS